MEEDFKKLSKYLDIIFENDNSFLETFTIGGEILVSVHFSDTNMKFVFILHSGQHIVDEKDLGDFLNWYKKIINKNGGSKNGK